jgi:pimeloyl-ACP methyl ester carboxylesterase/predicted glycosyltransferase
MRRADTGTPARLPDEQGVVERDGVRVYWESFGGHGPAILLLPTWTIAHSRHWKAQIPYLARRFHVVTFDGRGNGLSDRPQEPSAYDAREFVADSLAVLDAARVESACLAGTSLGGLLALLLAARHPERVDGAFLIAPSVEALAPQPDPPDFDAELPSYEGDAKWNRHYWVRDYRGFLDWITALIFSDPHSTKLIDDAIAFGLDTTPETLVATRGGGDSLAGTQAGITDRAAAEALCRSVRCPVVVVHGSEDRVSSIERGQRIAELTGGELFRFEGTGHAVQGRDPVRVNLLLRDFAERLAGLPPKGRTWIRGVLRPRRALAVSSPIGLGHVWRDIAIADELRRQVPGLEVQWLAQEPVATVLRARGETILAASAGLAGEAAHIDREAGEHDLHAFEALRRMDEILCANFMVFADVVADEPFDVWIADEAWDVDHFLHENPELKTAPLAWLTDFVGYLPMPAGGEREAFLTADYNAEMIEHVERRPALRDRAIFIGDPEDVVPAAFGPGLPGIREWSERHFSFAGYVPGFDPRTVADQAALRAELGYGDAPLCLVSAGGSGVGAPMLRRVIEALAIARERVPGLRMVAVTGPRIDPAVLPRVDGLEVRGYVHGLYKHFAACDVAVVQGGLTTTMELVIAGRPFVAIPLGSHFEQRFHVRHRLDRYGARTWVEYEDALPETLADAIAAEIARRPSYRPVETGGAARAAALIAELL